MGYVADGRFTAGGHYGQQGIVNDLARAIAGETAARTAADIALAAQAAALAEHTAALDARADSIEVETFQAECTAGVTSSNLTVGVPITGLVAPFTVTDKPVIAEIAITEAFNSTPNCAWIAVIYLGTTATMIAAAGGGVVSGSGGAQPGMPASARSSVLYLSPGDYYFLGYLKAVNGGTAQILADQTYPSTLTVREVA